MKYVLTAIFFVVYLWLMGHAFAAAPDYRISDGDGHVLDIAADGGIYISTTNGAIVNTAGALDMRISDGDSDVLDINSNGTVNVNTN